MEEELMSEELTAEELVVEEERTKHNYCRRG
jgi:hypothetical protein